MGGISWVWQVWHTNLLTSEIYIIGCYSPILHSTSDTSVYITSSSDMIWSGKLDKWRFLFRIAIYTLSFLFFSLPNPNVIMSFISLINCNLFVHLLSINWNSLCSVRWKAIFNSNGGHLHILNTLVHGTYTLWYLADFLV